MLKIFPYSIVVHAIMPKKLKSPNFYALILIFIGIATTFSSVKGWCVERGNEKIGAHIELLDCHSDFPIGDTTTLVNVETTHPTDKKKCTTCYDIRPDILAAKVLDDSFGSLVFPPLCNGIPPPQEYSGLKTFSIPSPGDVVAIDQLSSRQTQQNKALRTVVLLI